MEDYNNTTYYDKNNIIKKDSTLTDIYTRLINIEKNKQAYEDRLKKFWDNFNKKTIKEKTDKRTFWKNLAKDMEKDIGIAPDPEYLMVTHKVGYDPYLPRQTYSRSATTSSPATSSSPATKTRAGIRLRTTYDGRVSPTPRNTGTSGTSGKKKLSSTTRSKSRI